MFAKIRKKSRYAIRFLHLTVAGYRIQAILFGVFAFISAVGAVQMRWNFVDGAAFFSEGEKASRNFYAQIDDIFDNDEMTEKIRGYASSRIVGVLVEGDIKSPLSFAEECNILLNDPLQDVILPEELRLLLDAMTLDRREQVITTVSQIYDGFEENPRMNADEKTRYIWDVIQKWESGDAVDSATGNIIFQIVSFLSKSETQTDALLTDRMKNFVSSDIEPMKTFSPRGTLIVEKGGLITPRIAEVLRRQGYAESPFPLVRSLFAFLVALASVLWLKRTARNDPAVSSDSGGWIYPCFLLVLGWLVQAAAVAFRVNGLGLFPVIAVAYLTLSDTTAFICSILVTLSASLLAAGGDMPCFSVNIISGCIATPLGLFVFRKNYSRSAVWGQVFGLGAVMLCVTLTIQWGVLGIVDKTQILHMLAFGAFFVLAVVGALPAFEWGFDIVSPLLLTELTQVSQPLLKRLQIEAPGTYHHCQMVGNLAEAAAEAIGLNPVLMRAGACYHDIGKLKRPQYFVENQFSGENAHDSLSPAMSAMLIIGHVKDGLELAARYNLPTRIRNFIAEHHGTTSLGYFYKKALQAGLKVNESQFSYQGPRPQSKETALLMLADSTEAASRAVSRTLKHVNDLSHLVDDVVASKMNASQMDDVPFTLKEITQIKAAFVATLRSMYHTRDIKPLADTAPRDRKDLPQKDEKQPSLAVQAQATAKKEA